VRSAVSFVSMIKLSPKLRDFFGSHGQIDAELPNHPVFVIGCMRSGTTLLVNLLSAHPQLLKIGSELNEVWTDVGGADCLKYCNGKTAEEANVQSALNMWKYFQDFITESKGIKRKIIRWADKNREQRGRVNYDWPNVHPMNKSPHLVNKIDYVKALFPEAKFVFISRSIHGQAQSQKAHFLSLYKDTGIVNHMTDDENSCWHRVPENELGSGASVFPGDFSTIPKMWLRLHSTAFASLIKLERNDYCVVQYEDLIRNQAITMEKIFTMLQLLPIHKEAERAIGQKVISYKNTSTIGDSLSKWEDLLSEDEKHMIDSVISNNSEEYNAITTWLSSQ